MKGNFLGSTVDYVYGLITPENSTILFETSSYSSSIQQKDITIPQECIGNQVDIFLNFKMACIAESYLYGDDVNIPFESLAEDAGFCNYPSDLTKGDLNYFYDDDIETKACACSTYSNETIQLTYSIPPNIQNTKYRLYYSSPYRSTYLKVSCLPKEKTCIPDSSCASNTCIGETCLDSCGNVYQGTKDCSTNCTPDCSGKECGGDGCGDICGTCDSDEECIVGLCIEENEEEPETTTCELWEEFNEETGECEINMMLIYIAGGLVGFIVLMQLIK